MQPTFSFYVGIDWATQTHRVCVMDANGEVLREQTVQHEGDAIREFLGSLDALTGSQPEKVGVAIEVPRGPVVEAFLERNYAVFGVNPKQLDRFRDRHSVAGAKDDRRDAFVLADSLRTDEQCFRRLALEPATVIRLRELSRTDESLAGDLRRAANQLYQLLLRYYPQILQLCSYPDEPWLWTLLEAAPTPDGGRKLTLARLRTLLAKHHIRRLTPEEVREVLGQSSLPVAPGVAEAVSERVLLMLPHLRLLHQQRKDLAERMDAQLKRIAVVDGQAPDSVVGRDLALMMSIPGVGRTISATLVAEAYDALAQRDYHALRAHGGTAPVTRQSGKARQVSMRYGCNHRLRNAFYHWARTSLQNDERSKNHYARLRSVGHGHGRSLRGVADRLVAVLIAILKSGRNYDSGRRGQYATCRPAP